MRKYISMLGIESYRGIKNLRIENLSSINVLVGDNNTGKTSALEAVQLICDPSKYNLLKVASQRDNPSFLSQRRLNRLESLTYMFNQENIENYFDSFQLFIRAVRNGDDGYFTVTGEKGKGILSSAMREEISSYMNAKAKPDEIEQFIGEIKSTFSECCFFQQFAINEFSEVVRKGRDEKGIINSCFVQAFDHVLNDSFSSIIRNLNNKEKAIRLLEYFDESISDLRYINESDQYIPVIENTQKGTLPLTVYGDGMKKVITLLNAIISSENGVVLIDEFETAIHTSVMKKSFKFILRIAEELKVQLFLTTHSLEAVDKLLEAGENYLEETRVIRLKKKNDKTSARVLTGREAKSDREKYNVELRI